MAGSGRTPEERAAAAAERRRRRGVTTSVREEPLRREPPRREPPRPAPPAPRAPRRDLPPAMRGPSYTGRRITALIVVLVVGAAVFVAFKTFQPFHGDARGAVRVRIEPGSSVGDIGKTLAARGIIDSSTYFTLNATLTGRRGGLRPGTYTLARGMRYGTVLDALTKGPRVKVIKTFKLTLPEGLSISELAPRIKQAGISGDYEKAARAPETLRRARALGLPRDGETPEGFLFPATYDLPEGATAEDLVAQQLNAFRDNFAGVGMRQAKNKNLTRYDVVIIASMVEREAQLDRERPLVAAVIYNRLSAGMVLGIDATTRYEYENWTDPLLQSQLDADTPYNTRLNRDLPPTPIGNPGLASLKAAAHPAKVPYLYYVVKPGTCGRHNFSSTDAEFQRDVAAYDAAREQAGGKSPTTC